MIYSSFQVSNLDPIYQECIYMMHIKMALKFLHLVCKLEL